MDMQKWTLACICYAMGRIRVEGYDCVLYARQTRAYHKYTNVHFSHLIPRVFVLFGVLYAFDIHKVYGEVCSYQSIDLYNIYS